MAGIEIATGELMEGERFRRVKHNPSEYKDHYTALLKASYEKHPSNATWFTTAGIIEPQEETEGGRGAKTE
ncbi:MAG: hypothetical protein GY861_02980 [bacterium]|nr:hypothetical protein [bacterium]